MRKVNVMEIKGIKGFEENGTVWIAVEPVAISLGITMKRRTKNYYGEEVIYTVVNWGRLNKYLMEIKCIPEKISGEGYIKEETFYRLAMKVKNKNNEKFIETMATEIIPSFRRHCRCVAPSTISRTADKTVDEAEVLRRLVQELQDRNENLTNRNQYLEEKNKLLEDRVVNDSPKVYEHDNFFNTYGAYRFREVAKGLGVKEKDLIKALHDNAYIYRTSRMPWLPCVYRKQYFKVIKVAKGKWKGHQTLIRPEGIKICEELMGIDFDSKRI